MSQCEQTLRNEDNMSLLSQSHRSYCITIQRIKFSQVSHAGSVKCSSSYCSFPQVFLLNHLFGFFFVTFARDISVIRTRLSSEMSAGCQSRRDNSKTPQQPGDKQEWDLRVETILSHSNEPCAWSVASTQNPNPSFTAGLP